jgi:hypothetical protein
MTLTRKDLGGTVVAAVAVLVLVANLQDWWYLGNVRWAALTMLGVGMVGCSLGSAFAPDQPRMPVLMLSLLGVVALGLVVAAVVTAAQWALVALTLVLVALWLGATARHAVTPHRAVPA